MTDKELTKELRFTPATPAHIPLIRKIAFETWPSAFSTILSPDQIDYMLGMMYSPEVLLQEISDRNIQYFMIGESAGFTALEMNYLPDLLYAKIHKIYLSPPSQKGGKGKQTIRYLSDLARVAGQDALILNVNKHNPAIRFYERTGFHKWKSEVIDIGSGFVMDDYIFRKIL